MIVEWLFREDLFPNSKCIILVFLLSKCLKLYTMSIQYKQNYAGEVIFDIHMIKGQ